MSFWAAKKSNVALGRQSCAKMRPGSISVGWEVLLPAPSPTRAVKDLLCLTLLVSLTGCGSTVVIRWADDAVLTRVAEKANGEFSVFWHGENHLHLRKSNIHMSIMVGGWNTFHADLMLEGGQLRAEFYGRIITPVLLCIPIYAEVGPPRGGAGLFTGGAHSSYPSIESAAVAIIIAMTREQNNSAMARILLWMKPEHVDADEHHDDQARIPRAPGARRTGSVVPVDRGVG